MEKAACAPNINTAGYTCYTPAQLKKLAVAYNRENKDNKITITADTHKLWMQLRDKYKGQCNTEYCWLKKNMRGLNRIINGNKDELREYMSRFMPEMPAKWRENPQYWLSTSDIVMALNRYSDADKELYIMGVYPIDFMSIDEESRDGRCIADNMCKFRVDRALKRGIKRVGAVFNLDRHDQPGSHWVALYMCIDKDSPQYGIYYYDSTGYNIPPQIMKFANIIKSQLEELGYKSPPIMDNKRMHQKSDGNCGIYAIHFIVKMSEGADYKRLMQDTSLKDENIGGYRGIYFTK
jgi:hypothetical protein